MDATVKEGVIALAKAIWESAQFKLVDTERTRALRYEVLQRALSAVMTDDERAQFYGLPEGCRMRESAKIIDPPKFKCGRYVWIGEGTMVDASGGLTVGDHTTLAGGALIWSHSSAMANLMMDNSSANPYIVRKATRIGSGTYIGGPSVVYHGVTIGDRVIVLPMSVVTEDVADRTMVAGAPARLVRHLDDAYIERFRAEMCVADQQRGS